MALSIKVADMSNELTYYERQTLEYWLRSRMSLREIGKIMRRAHTILSREIRRNGIDRKKYRADVAHGKHEERKHKQHRGKLDKYPKLKRYVEEKLRLDWSPEQIAGRLKAEPPAELAGLGISHESIYYYVYSKAEKYKKLYVHLRTNRLKRKKLGQRKSQKTCIPSRVSIHHRPECISSKERYGDWESDTVEFRRTYHNPYLSVQYERKSQLVRLHKMKNKSAEETNNALIQTAESVPKDIFLSITFDNGTEGTRHAEIREEYGLQTYFCDPFSSWQKGGVENMNKLVRQYLPRSADLGKYTDRDIYEIQEKLNNRPRKGLNYATPNEIINKVVL